jgi:DNA-binding response OmpR family regulator
MPGQRILLVEDDREVAHVLEHVLFDDGYTVEVVDTAAAAYQRINHGTYSLVIADFRLPDGNGVQVANEAAERSMKTAIITTSISLRRKLRIGTKSCSNRCGRSNWSAWFGD